MSARLAGFVCILLLSFGTPAHADVGERALDQITRLQSSSPFKNVAVDHGPIAGTKFERWKFETSSLEQTSFTVDAKNINSPVVRETYVRVTDIDPYSLRPSQATGHRDLREVLSARELSDFLQAAALKPIEEPPLHLRAFFYRGRYAAYEVLEPQTRTPGVQNRFEWRSFALSQLGAIMKAARSCDNGPDCAAWY